MEREIPVSIVIIPINMRDTQVINFIKDCIPGIIPGTTCTVGETIGYPPWAIDVRRNQILSIEILYHLELKKDLRHYDFVLGVIDYDLYAPGLNFVFGQAMELIALISVTRLNPEFYGEKPDRAKYYRRILTEAVHELGHAFGLPHCTIPTCVMYFSNSIDDTDRKGYNFCNRCKTRLQNIINKLR